MIFMIERCLLFNKRPEGGEILYDNQIYKEEYVVYDNYMMGRWLLRTKGRKEEELKQNIWGFPSLLSSQRIESTLSTDDIFL